MSRDPFRAIVPAGMLAWIRFQVSAGHSDPHSNDPSYCISVLVPGYRHPRSCPVGSAASSLTCEASMKLPPLLGTSSLICEASMKLPPLLGLVALIRHSGADPCRFLGSPLERSATRSTCVRGSNGSWIRLRFLLAVMTLCPTYCRAPARLASGYRGLV